MSILAVRLPVREAASAFTREHLASLAATYAYASQPVWVRDLADRCVYQNPLARRTIVPLQPALTCEILDHRGIVVGSLATVLP
jgi:hypothetical protein